MNTWEMSRRDLLVQGSAALIGLALLKDAKLARAFPSRPGEEVIPWMDQPPPHPRPHVVSNQLKWEELDAWITPNAKFFRVAHYQGPLGPAIDERQWSLEITGLVKRPLTMTLSQLKARPRQEVTFTLECSGNHGFPFFIGGIGTATWAGTPLAPLLQEAEVLDKGIEVVFVGSDAGEEEVRGIKMTQNFARSMSLADAMNPDNLLCYEMNGEPLPQPHGFPLRLIAPGWYGVANVKWLKRIEIRPSRFMGRFMARDYVTIREEQRNGETVWMETSVGRALLKSVPAKVARQNGQYRIVGAAWGAPIQGVEVQVDGGAWMPATIDQSEEAEFAWKIWSLAWPKAAPGEHTITSRAIDAAGHIQPAMDDPWIAKKRTYWESNGQVTRRIRLT
ncbi:MAG TPA: sulfite oxidase [Alphaproteobacteria bacterium]|nr:sulfite oxidase [Alphaproteobacteria bacterium]